jgi:phospholipase/carboxylesterase
VNETTAPQASLAKLASGRGLVHLVREPLQATPGPTPTVVLLHGVGSNERDLFRLAHSLDPRLLVVSPRAPLENAPGRYRWFQVDFSSGQPLIVPEEAEASRQALVDFLEELTRERGLDPRSIFLAGFSQGAIMAASVALTRPELVGGAAMIAGRILPEIRPLLAPHGTLEGLPFLVLHGLLDDKLPVQHARASRELLSSLPVRLEYHETEGGHGIGPEALQHLSDWLDVRVSGS